MPWGTYIYGDCYYRTTAPNEPGNGITGVNTSMSSDLVFPTPTVPGGAIDLGAVNVGWQGGAIGGGTYKCSSITAGGGGTITITGNVDVYCTGTASFGNGCSINTNGAANKLTLYMTSAATADFNMSSPFYMIVYGPAATLNLSGSSPMVGSCVVKALNLSGSATLSATSALAIPVTPTGGTGGPSSGTGTISVTK